MGRVATLWQWNRRFRLRLGMERVLGRGREFGGGGIAPRHFPSGAMGQDEKPTPLHGPTGVFRGWTASDGVWSLMRDGPAAEVH